MTPRVVRIGERSWPGSDDLLCDVYEWTSQGLLPGTTVKMRFLSPRQDGPREFYLQPLLEAHFLGRRTQYLERACDAGHAALRLLGGRVIKELFEEVPGNQRLFAALFRNRNEGHFAIRRSFRSDLDFVSFESGRPTLVVPGLADEEERREDTLRGTARQRARRAVVCSTAPYGAGDKRGFDAVFRTCEGLLDAPAPAAPGAALPGDWLPELGLLEQALIGGVGRRTPWPAREACAQVRSALIYGPVSPEDQAGAFADREQARRFVGPLLKRANSGRTHTFDRWLQNAREHGFLSLFGATRLEEERQEAAAQGARLYCALLWATYQYMARRYAALMLLAGEDLDKLLGLTGEEAWLFSQWHLPQLHLGGLPLSFFGRAQFRWVFPLLAERWRAGVLDPAAYDVVTRMLGLFGALARLRRSADRDAKRRLRGRGGHGRPGAAHRPSADHSRGGMADRSEGPPRFTCRCGGRLLPDPDTVNSDGRFIRFRARCGKCDNVLPREVPCSDTCTR